MIDEIKSLPDTKVSNAPELFKRAGGHYSKLGTNTAAAIKALRIDLRRRTTTIPHLTEEARYAFDDALGRYHPDWSPLAVFPQINRAVAIVSGRVFLGKRLSRQEEWISLSSEWAVRVFGIMRAIQRYPSWLRPYITPLLPETKEVLVHRAKAKAFLEPTFSKHIEAKENGTTVPGEEEEESLTSWLMKYLAPRHTTIEGLTRHQLSITWASIHTSTYALTQVLFDLAAKPEYQDILREEIEQVFSNGGTEELTQADLPKLAKMDSFMKESMRLNPITIVAPLRMVTGDAITLSSGQILRPGDSFAFDSTSINSSQALYSSPGPESFDGLRFYRMRQREGEEQKHQFGATGVQETFDFGHGIHACPGRHFATTEIKIMLIQMLTSYDFKLKDGHKRPSNGLDEIWFHPDSTAEVLIKSR
ncbi:GliF [Apiospora sp. TS-2023a]